MTLNLYAVLIVIIALFVICVYGAMLVVVSADVGVWKGVRQKIAEKYTYWISLEIAGFVFAMMYLV